MSFKWVLGLKKYVGENIIMDLCEKDFENLSWFSIFGFFKTRVSCVRTKNIFKRNKIYFWENFGMWFFFLLYMCYGISLSILVNYGIKILFLVICELIG